MKKVIFPVLGAVGLVAFASGLVLTSGEGPRFEAPQSAVDLVAPPAPSPISKAPSQLSAALAEPEAMMPRLVPGGTFVAPAEADIHTRRAPKGAPVASLADIAGSYVQMSYTLSSSTGNTGNATPISVVEGTDSILIERFWTNNNPYIAVKAAVDKATGTVSIPSQVVMTSADLGPISLAVCSNTGKPVRDAEIKGVVDADGSIYLETWWGLFVDGDNQYKDVFLTVNYGTTFERANGRLIFSDDKGTYGYDVRVEQTLDNVVTVKNFANYGLSTDIELYSDRTAIVPASVVAYAIHNNELKGFYPISQLQLNDAGALTGAVNGIACSAAPADVNNQIAWGDWSLMASGVWFGKRNNGSITWNTGEFSYPKDYAADFEGEGTVESPYLIKSKEDLQALAAKVNSDTNLDYQNVAGSKYARVYLGKHFRLENDVDLSSTRFVPIGCDWAHYFAGSFDGNGKKISGLTVQRSGTYGMGGLFGRTDTTTVVKNLTLVSPDIESSYFTGAVVGWSLGHIENCHVIDPTINNTGVGTGGVAGATFSIKNCTVKGGNVTGLGGYVGGLVGELSSSGTSVNIIAKGWMDNCHVVETVVRAWCSASGYPAGGVVGNCYVSDMKNSSFAGSISSSFAVGGEFASMNVGGVAGNLFDGTMEKCFASGDYSIYGSSSRLGGLAGSLKGNIVDCYVSGRVYGYSSKMSGGLTGQVSRYLSKANPAEEPVPSVITNAYAATQTFAETYQINNDAEPRELLGTVGYATDTQELEPNVTLTNAYYDKQLTDFGGNRYGVFTSELVGAAGPAGFNAANWVFAEGAYPRLKGISEGQSADVSASAIDFSRYSNSKMVQDDLPLTALGDTKFFFLRNSKYLSTEGYYARIENNSTIVIGEEVGSDTLVVLNGAIQYPVILKIAPSFLEGHGVAEDPYLISTKADLIALSKATTEAGSLYPDTYFRITNDIDLEYDPEFLGICTNASDAHNKFAGIIDGGNFTIHRMKLRGVVWQPGKTPADDPEGLGTPKTGTGGSFGYQGFIGRLGEEGVLKNLRFAADCDGECWATAGMAVGDLYGTVENCRNYADVTGYSCWIGGIVGMCEKGAVIRDCYNAGNITTGYNLVGGITGRLYGTIENCVNTGDIVCKPISRFRSDNGKTKFNYAGGITGGCSDGALRNVLNTGSVLGLTDLAGGISGALPAAGSTSVLGNTIVSALNIGMVETRDLATIGTIAGDGGTTGEVASVYYDRQILPYGAMGNVAVAGCIGATSADLTSGKPLEGLSEEIWDYKEGMYPVLKMFADEPKLNAARQIVLTMPADMTAFDFRGEAKLAKVKGMSWKLTQEAEFKMYGSNLFGPTEVNTVVNDTLVATYETIVKVIPISAKPGCPVAGEGTVENPYQISSVDDWNNFSDWMLMMMDDMTGRTIKLMADLDFTDKEFKPYGTTVTAFGGTFDGAGHTVKGIEYTTTAQHEGIFKTLLADGVIKDLNIEGTVNTSFAYTGGLVGDNYGTIENCVNSLVVTDNTNTAHANIGGFAAYTYAGAKYINCVFKGAVEATSSYVGAITGFGLENVLYQDCGNEGAISSRMGSTSASGAAVYLGGLVGSSRPSKFIRCYNKGAIAVTATASNVAGLVGYLQAQADVDPYEFTDCWNESDITAFGTVGGLTALTGTNVGTCAIVAKGCYNTGAIHSVSAKAVSSTACAGLFAFYTAGSSFADCYNKGEITSDKNVYCAGIIGNYKSAPTEAFPVTVTNCWNEGTINGMGNQAAGVIAYVGNFTTVDHCYNVAPVTATMMAGGIASTGGSNTSFISNCWNTGEINACNRVGGIAALANSNKSTIVNCWNSAVVTATALGGATGTTVANGVSAGGIVGQGSMLLERCYNLGDVTGAARVGGLVGSTTKGTATATNTTIRNSYNAGKVVARQQNAEGEIVAAPDSCGYIIGVNPDNPAKNALWSEFNVVENTFYLTDLGTETSLRSPGTAATTAQLCGVDPMEGKLGEGWKAEPYCLPVLDGDVTTDLATLNSIRAFAPKPTEPDATPVITDHFFIGNPAGTAWTFNPDKATISGNTVSVEAGYQGDLVATATLGEVSRQITVKVDLGSSISDIAAGRQILSEEWFNLSGMKISRPAEADGGVYIVRLTYTEGTSETVKIINR